MNRWISSINGKVRGIFHAVLAALMSLTLTVGCSDDGDDGNDSSTTMETTYTLTTSVTPTAGGTVSPTGTTTHNAGAQVSVTATAASTEYVFTGWTGTGTPTPATANPATITMNGDKTLTANFALVDDPDRCEIRLSQCPNDYDGFTLLVPLDYVGVSPQIPACAISDTVETGVGEPPSIVFIIDQSSSMYNEGYDPNANRYKAVSAILDTLYAKTSSAEVGVVIFMDDLIFDNRNDNAARRRLYDPNLVMSNAQGLSGQSLNGGAYMPFLRLNDASDNIIRGGYFSTDSSHSTRANGVEALTGYDVLKNIMKIRDTAFSQSRSGQDIDYGPFYGASGTNVSRAFDAARIILQSAKASRENQYIIFISDGESNRPNNNQAQQDHYMLGLDVPTTFTVFLSPTGEVHPNLQTMSDNIRANNQDNSNIWGLTSNYDDFLGLMSLMMDNIITPPVLTTASGVPNRITISVAGVADSSVNITDGFFIFRERLPLDTSTVTNVTMNIRYNVRIDSTYMITNRNPPKDTTVTWIVRDSLFVYTFGIQRTANPPIGWDAMITSSCGGAANSLQGRPHPDGRR